MNVALRPEHHPLNLISLCTGGGGLDRAVELAIPGARPVVCVERESFSVAALVAQIEDGLMAPAAIWSDVRTFAGRPWRGRVDGLIGGIPCQPHSLAGRRGGSTDERDLWSPARRIIAQARPWFVLIENVGGFLSAGADEIPGAARVRGDLRKLGFEVAGCIVRASDMGLPHERERVFILGVANWFLADRGRAGWQGGGSAGSGPGECSTSERGGERLGDAECSGLFPGSLACLHRQQEGVGARDGAAERPSRDLGDVARLDGGLHQGSRREGPGAADPGGSVEVVDAIGGGHHGRPQGEVREPVGGTAEQQSRPLCDEQHLAHGDGGEPAPQRRDLGEVRRLSEGQGGANHSPALSRGGRPFLRPPGPGDADAWRHVALVAPGLLPAVSRYDRLRLEMGAQGVVAAGDPPAGRAGWSQARKARRGAGQGASAWVDAGTGERLGAADVQAAVERALRGVADVMAPRIDELRMLGNGVADAQGALAVRTCVHDLAARGSSGAALLVRMMEAA